MFYLASKPLWFLAAPSNLLLVLALAGALLALSRWRRMGRRLLALGIGGFLLAGLSPLGNMLILPTVWTKAINVYYREHPIDSNLMAELREGVQALAMTKMDAEAARHMRTHAKEISTSATASLAPKKVQRIHIGR